MPHIIVSTAAVVSNLYTPSLVVVGDKDSNPELMKQLGARVTTAYPSCGSPAMYVTFASPRSVLDELERRGYVMEGFQFVEDHIVWIMKSQC